MIWTLHLKYFTWIGDIRIIQKDVKWFEHTDTDVFIWSISKFHARLLVITEKNYRISCLRIDYTLSLLLYPRVMFEHYMFSIVTWTVDRSTP